MPLALVAVVNGIAALSLSEAPAAHRLSHSRAQRRTRKAALKRLTSLPKVSKKLRSASRQAYAVLISEAIEAAACAELPQFGTHHQRPAVACILVSGATVAVADAIPPSGCQKR